MKDSEPGIVVFGWAHESVNWSPMQAPVVVSELAFYLTCIVFGPQPTNHQEACFYCLDAMHWHSPTKRKRTTSRMSYFFQCKGIMLWMHFHDCTTIDMVIRRNIRGPPTMTSYLVSPPPPIAMPSPPPKVQRRRRRHAGMRRASQGGKGGEPGGYRTEPRIEKNNNNQR